LKAEADVNGHSSAYNESLRYVQKAKDKKSWLYQEQELKDDYLIALSLYTSPAFYRKINEVLRTKSAKPDDLLKYSKFLCIIYKRFSFITIVLGCMFSRCSV